MNDLKAKLIAAACSKTVRQFMQYDGWSHDCDAPLFHPDPDGHCISFNHTWELRRSDCPVRVQINPYATSKTEVLALLKKIRQCIKRGWGDYQSDALDTPKADSQIPPF